MKLGKIPSVTAQLGADTGMLLDKARRNTVTTEITLEESLTAPVEAGQKIGAMTIKAGDEILAEVPLVASEEVARLTWADLFGKILGRIVMAP